MVRTLDLARWAGRWVALDENDEVQAEADTLKALMAIVDADGLEGVSIMRAPAPGEPVVYGATAGRRWWATVRRTLHRRGQRQGVWRRLR